MELSLPPPWLSSDCSSPHLVPSAQLYESRKKVTAEAWLYAKQIRVVSPAAGGSDLTSPPTDWSLGQDAQFLSSDSPSEKWRQ